MSGSSNPNGVSPAHALQGPTQGRMLIGMQGLSRTDEGEPQMSPMAVRAQTHEERGLRRAFTPDGLDVTHEGCF